MEMLSGLLDFFKPQQTEGLIAGKYYTIVPNPPVINGVNLSAPVSTNTLRRVTLSGAPSNLSTPGTDYFYNIYSVDAVQRAKPFPEIYQHAANKEGCTPKQIAMIASHDWDILGAKQAGFRTGYIFRKQMPLNPLYPTADAVGSELMGLVQQIITPKDA